MTNAERQEKILAKLKESANKLGQHYLISEAALLGSAQFLINLADEDIANIDLRAYLVAKYISSQLPDPQEPMKQVIGAINRFEAEITSRTFTNPVENIISQLNILNAQIVKLQARSQLK